MTTQRTATRVTDTSGRPITDYPGMLFWMDEYLQGLGPMDRPSWDQTFRDVRAVLAPCVADGGEEEAWADLVEHLENLEAFWRFDAPECSDAAGHLLEVALELERKTQAKQ